VSMTWRGMFGRPNEQVGAVIVGPEKVILGGAVQVEPIKPKLKPHGTKRLKLKCDKLLSTSAFRFS
jgi:hypothetical protein